MVRVSSVGYLQGNSSPLQGQFKGTLWAVAEAHPPSRVHEIYLEVTPCPSLKGILRGLKGTRTSGGEGKERLRFPFR